jgi:hypothetical protein
MDQLVSTIRPKTRGPKPKDYIDVHAKIQQLKDLVYDFELSMGRTFSQLEKEGGERKNYLNPETDRLLSERRASLYQELVELYNEVMSV